MVRPRISLGLLVLSGEYALGAVDAPCSRTATARPGDTCATLGAVYGLSVSDFLRANPGLSVCALVPGSAYCVASDGTTATAPPPAPVSITHVPPPPPPPPPLTPPVTSTPSSTPSATSSPAKPTGTLVPSPDGSDGTCGGQYTCLGSVYGDCCSINGYCGNTTDYCGDSCNPLFGRCGGGAAECESASTVTVTVRGNVSSVTVTSTITKAQTSTQTATVTKTVTASVVPTPSPVFPGTNTKCEFKRRRQLYPMTPEERDWPTNLCDLIGNRWYQVRANDRCQVIARSYGITIAQLYSWNPNVRIMISGSFLPSLLTWTVTI